MNSWMMNYYWSNEVDNSRELMCDEILSEIGDVIGEIESQSIRRRPWRW